MLRAQIEMIGGGLVENKEKLNEIKKHIQSAEKALGYLMSALTISPEKFNTMLDVTIIQFETSTIDMRRLVESTRKHCRKPSLKLNSLHRKELFGEVEITDNGWLHIRLDTLLPNCKLIEHSGYITDSITRLLNNFSDYGGTIPFFEKAFVAIIERCGLENRKSFDNDNKGFKAVQNALKGRLFADDNQFELSIGLFTELSDEIACHVYVMPENEAADFFYLRHGEGL